MIVQPYRTNHESGRNKTPEGDQTYGSRRLTVVLAALGVRAFSVLAHKPVSVVYLIVVARAVVAGADLVTALECLALVVLALRVGHVGDMSVPVLASYGVAVERF